MGVSKIDCLSCSTTDISQRWITTEQLKGKVDKEDIESWWVKLDISKTKIST